MRGGHRARGSVLHVADVGRVLGACDVPTPVIWRVLDRTRVSFTMFLFSSFIVLDTLTLLIVVSIDSIARYGFTRFMTRLPLPGYATYCS